MSDKSENKLSSPPRVLMFSQRNIYSNIHFRLGLYEFEDIISQVDSVDLLAPWPKKWFKYSNRIASRLVAQYGYGINPGIPKIDIHEKYELFFAIAQFPSDLLHLKYIGDWRNHCKTSICWLNEVWVPDVVRYKYYLRILSEFDYVIVHWIGSLNAVQEVVQGKCFYLPYGIDAILFCPYPNPPKRVIDVYSIGRRSEETHQALLRTFRNGEIFYVYDTSTGSQVNNPEEHRLLFANMAKRSRYFIVNPGKRDDPGETAGQIEFGNRFFEGAASGTILIGETPKNLKFDEVFNWTDAVIHIPFGSDKIGEIINELDSQPQRQAEIRKKNVTQSLIRHDWVYRWESILKIAGLNPLPQLLERKKRLRELSNMVEKVVLP